MPPMADDYRIKVEFEDEGRILHFGRSLREREFAQELREELGDGVVVTRDGPEVFLYASSPEQARAAERAVREELAEQEVEAEVSPVERWHPVEETWQDASIPLPQSDEEIAAERARQEADEAQDSREQGYAEWQVRVDLPAHRDAVELAERLEAEGISPLVRRWKYILIGTETDEQARALAERIRAEAPADAEVNAEPSAAIGWELTGRNPFATFGGFGPGPA
jgi:hypothetical protein